MYEIFYPVAGQVSMWLLPAVWLLIEVGWIWLAVFIGRSCRGIGPTLILVGVVLSTLTVLFDSIESYRYNITGESYYDGSALMEFYGMGYSYVVVSALVLPGLVLVFRDVVARLKALEAENACLRDQGTEKGATRG